jgi:hypothetical protein
MRRAFAVLWVVSIPAGAPVHASAVHDFPFFPEALRPTMEWVDREAKRDDPFLRLAFLSHDSPRNTNETPLRDAFIGYRGPHGVAGHPPAGGPLDGARYGFEVGSDKWRVVYDSENHLAFYGESCCGFGRDVLLRVVTAAPRSVPRRNLGAMRTMRGVRLGMTAAQVMAREGPAPRKMDAAPGERTAFAYWTPVGGKTCVEERTFVFAHGRVQAIHVVEGC